MMPRGTHDATGAGLARRRRLRTFPATSPAALLAVALVAPAAVGRAALDSLARAAARRTARSAARRAAVADGYRRLGADFPGMGEHWLHPGALLSGGIDTGRPTLLMYAADAQGRPTLLGVGYVTTTRGASPAVPVPGWPDAWHEHSGLLADESGAGRGGAAAASGAGTRVWVLHAWTALANPDGPYAPDNWALPFARLGLAVPVGIDPDAGRALSLAVGGDAYLRGVLTDAGLTDASTARRAGTAVAAARARVEALAARARAAGGVMRPGDVAALRGEWQALAAALRLVLGPGVGRYLEPAHPQHHPAAPHHAP
jgi:hypothetical protein